MNLVFGNRYAKAEKRQKLIEKSKTRLKTNSLDNWRKVTFSRMKYWLKRQIT